MHIDLQNIQTFGGVKTYTCSLYIMLPNQLSSYEPIPVLTTLKRSSSFVLRDNMNDTK